MKYPEENDRGNDATQVRQGQMQISKGAEQKTSNRSVGAGRDYSRRNRKPDYPDSWASNELKFYEFYIV